MDVPDTMQWVSAPVEQRPFVPPAPAPEPAPTPRRRWVWPVAVAGGVAIATLGGFTGFAVADDADTVAKLEDAALDAEDEIEDLEALLADVDEAQADLQDDLQVCIDASTSTQSLLTAVDEVSNAFETYLLTPIGSQEEIEAFIALGDSIYRAGGTTPSVELDTEACLATKP